MAEKKRTRRSRSKRSQRGSSESPYRMIKRPDGTIEVHIADERLSSGQPVMKWTFDVPPNVRLSWLEDDAGVIAFESEGGSEKESSSGGKKKTSGSRSSRSAESRRDAARRKREEALERRRKKKEKKRKKS